ncbi:MAG: phosphotransferase [Alphaproteobacteria bacterium]|nr:phosphotransferase [Alphaproteobacteria bacterium]
MSVDRARFRCRHGSPHDATVRPRLVVAAARADHRGCAGVTPRAQLIDRFLAASGWGSARRRPLDGDASFRRYIRLIKDDGAMAMLMDAPPPQEDVRPFVVVDRHLRRLGFSAPDILAENAEHGFLLLEDLGDATFTRVLAEGGDETNLYALATDVLIALHRHAGSVDAPVPPYDDGRLLDEAVLLVDWFLPAVTGTPVTDSDRSDYLDLWRQMLPVARGVPDSLVLRDYHVDNLLRVDRRQGLAACGLLDFQDAVIGPCPYDLVSLLEDARRDISGVLIESMHARYLEAFPELDRDAFTASMAVLGAQRHAKVIGIFTRLDRRDGKPIYLRHIPRVWRLLERNLSHPALAELRRWIDERVPPTLHVAPPPCQSR